MINRRDVMKLGAVSLTVPMMRTERMLQVAAGQDAIPDWPMHGGNPERTRAMQGSGPRFDRPLVARWSWSGQYWSTPVIQNGVLYHAASELSGLTSVDFLTGVEQWRVLEGQSILYQIAHGETIFAAVDTHFLYALDSATGQERWRIRVDGLVSSSMVAVDERLYCRTEYGGVLALGTRDGAEYWYFEERADDYSSITFHDGSIYFGVGTGKFFALEANTGSERWQIPIAGNEPHTYTGINSIVADGKLYIRDGEGGVHALNPETGDSYWRTPVGESYALSSALNGRVFGSNEVHGACAFDAETGQQQWTFNTGMMMSVSGIFEDTVLVHGTAGWREMWRVHGVDATSGEERWSFESPPRSYDPTVIGNHLMLHGLSGYVLGNETMATLREDVILRGAPTPTGIQRGIAYEGDEIDEMGIRQTSDGLEWIEVTIGNATGWIMVDAIDPATLPSEGGSDHEFVFYPE